MKLAMRLALLIGLIAVSNGSILAQVTTGTPPFSKIRGGPVDKIDLANLNAHLDIPIVNKAGRGINFIYTLGYDNSVWTPVGSSGSQTWEPAENWGWSAESAAATGEITYTETMQPTSCYYGPGEIIYLSGFSYLDPFGTPHPIPGAYVVSACGGFGGQGGTASDGSGYALVPCSSEGLCLYSRTGKLINAPYNSQAGAGSYVDSNGNEITVSSSEVFTDTLGTTALTVSGTAPNDTTFQYTGPQNNTQQYTMKYKSYTVQTDFSCSGVSEFPATQEYLVSEIDLPDGSKYIFHYEHTPNYPNSRTGRLASVTLPTNGTIYYTYSGPNDGIECTDGSTSGLTRQTPDGTSTYSRTLGSGAASTTTMNDPQGNQTVMNFVGIYPTEEQVYQGSSSGGQLLKTTITCYNGSTPSGSPATCNSDSINLPITQQTVYTEWPTGQESETNTTYNSYGLVTEEDDYDYGSGAPGSLLRKTITTYASLGNNIVNRPASITVCGPGGTASACNGSGTVVAQTTYQYDQTTPASSGITTQHVSVSGSRGNLTGISQLTSGSSILAKTFTYFDTGNVQTATDVNDAQTTYTYGACNGAFPTKIAPPLVPATTITWNCIGGVETSVTDANDQTVSTSYTDQYFWRPSSTTDQLNNTMNITYTGQTSVESTLNFGTSTADVLSTVDGLGRLELSQTKEAPNSSTYDSVQTIYDSDGRTYQTTLPYTAGAGAACTQNCEYTSTTYDALGRPLTVTDSGGGTITYNYQGNDVLEKLGPAPSGENPKQKQLEYDALGRLTSVCEITSASGSGPCPQTNAQTGYYTEYTYDALGDLTGVSQDSGAQTRWFTYDGLGRMTSETNPESGTTSYTYDADSTCGTALGDLVKKKDAVGNVACLAHDALHRITGMTYSGPYASITPSKYLAYDSATVNGVAMVNAKSRLAEAYTCFSPCSSKITDEGFSYTARGEVSDVYESTPHSGGYVHSNATFWANGALETLNDSAGYALSFGMDGEGRPYSSTDGSGGHPLASTAYNAASLPTQLNFGYTGDADSYAYDQNTDRMTQYKFAVNGQSLIGNLTWNDDGTLANLMITDPFNSANTQSCAYTHDDLARLASVSCSGSGWSQNFSYNAFGNLTVTGNGQFQPGYNSSNQMLSPATYDANGNATSDEEHTYAWDVDGQPVSIDGVAITYDALGRMVEENKSGTYSEIVYSPTGFKMQVENGGSNVAEYAPMPGGGASVWSSSGFYYRHGDWLGSSRFASTQSRTVYYDAAYAPFGQSYAQTGTADNNFTGKDQGTVAGLYDFPAREYNDREGRWASPDPAGLAAVNPADPQTWNRYAYVRNSPLGMTDPTGLCDGFGGTQWGYFTGSGAYVEYDDSPCDGFDGPDGPADPIPALPVSPFCNPYYLSGCVVYGFNPPALPTLPSGTGSSGPTPPTVNGKPQSPGCMVMDPIFSGLEYTGKLGPEVQVGPFKAGFSFYDNFTTGQSGGEAELNLGVLSIEYNVPTPPGGSLTGNQSGELSVSLFGFQKNFTTGQPWSFSPSKVWTLGLQGLVGGQVSLNSTTMNQQTKANEACIAKGGGG